MSGAFFMPVGELAALEPENWPDALFSSRHLIYSSPATLAFNSPGAQGFGVKRAALSIPGSVMLLFSPGCCGRNTSAVGGPDGRYGSRMRYLMLDETDIVTGRYLNRIVEAVREICESPEGRPSAVLLCSTCVDALLGTDMERVCRRASAENGLPVLSCTMYALTREGRQPPMVLVRRTIYSLLEKAEKQADAMNILGFFTPLRDDCELYGLCRGAGIRRIREIGRCRNMDEYREMAGANFNLVLHPESRLAASWMAETLGIASVELTRSYQPGKIRAQYAMLGQVLGVRFDDGEHFEKASEELAAFVRRHRGLRIAVGETANADPFELSLALLRAGLAVVEIFATVDPAHAVLLKGIAGLTPETRLYSNLSPSMLLYRQKEGEIDLAIGQDAGWYHPGCPCVPWNGESQPFGYAGLRALLEEMERALSGGAPSAGGRS